jgi:hypothetical protein
VAARREAGPEGRPIGVVIGLSTTPHAINAARLAEEGPPGYRWMLANGFGGTAHKLAEFARLLATSGLRPGAVLIAINPIMLADRPAPGPAEAGDGGGARPSLLRAVRERLWVVESRFHAKHLLRRSALFFKMGLLGRLGSDPGAAVAPANSAWETIELNLEGRLSPAEAARDRKIFADAGFYSPESYAADSGRSRELVEAVRAARSTGARVLVVLLPEMNQMRRDAPESAHRLPGEILAAAFGAQAPPILDLRDTVPDEDFMNFLHTNRQGNDLFTSILGRRLRDALR